MASKSVQNVPEDTEKKTRGPRRNVAIEGMNLPVAQRQIGAIGNQLAIVGGISGKAEYVKAAQACKALFDIVKGLK